ncbi:MAG: reverse transcriptase family protein, partial [Cyanobacteria bacterium J06553_1]
ACRRVRELISDEKQRQWREFVGELDDSTDPSRVWRVIRSLGGSSSASRARNEVLVHGDREYTTGSQKAELFCQHYAGVSRLEFSKEERLRNRRVFKRLRGLPSSTDDLPECQPFSEAELRRAIQQAKAKAASGEDGIAPRFLKNLGPVGRRCLLALLNESWESGYLPQSWRSADIIPLPKAGKPACDIASYRPVSLTSCVGKTLERMVAGRMQHLAEERGWWGQEQAGFRRRRCTEDQVLRLSQDISDGFQRSPSQRTVLALLDYSKAYDRVWREELLDVLMDCGLPRRFVVWVAGFLRNRLGRVTCAGVKGKRRIFRQGLPQGSVLSPLLFLFFVNGVCSVVPEGVRVSLYADDVAVWAQDRTKERALQKVLSAVQEIARWSQARKLQLSEGKCTLSLFSQDTREASWSPEVEVGGMRLRFEPRPTFLGVTLDRVLSFRPHAESVAARAGARSRVLSALAGQEWGWRRESLVPVFLAYIRSVLDYCAAGWQPWLARSSMGVLERAQNRALRIVTGQCRTTPVEALALEAGVPQYTTVARRKWVAAWEKALRLPAGHPRRLAAESAVPHRLKRNSSWRREVERVERDLGLGSPARE